MTTIYDGFAGTGRMEVTASPRSCFPRPVWLVTFTRWALSGKTVLSQCVAWKPTEGTWIGTSLGWHPTNSRLIPSAVLANVENWLRGRPVGEIEDTSTTTTEAT